MDARPLCLAALTALSACRDCGSHATPPPANDGPARGRECRRILDEGTRTFLEAHEPEYNAARGRATDWLDALRVDHLELRARGIKGKKKLVELLDSYVWLLRDPLEGEEGDLRARAAHIAAPTYESSWHDMAQIDDLQFKQDATSYMRAAYLMDGLGLDTRDYVDEIRKVLPRFNGHMDARGPAQQMIFHNYYEHFDLEEPFPLDLAFEKGRIAARAEPRSLGRMPIYHLTHEIFMPFRYGEVRETDFFDEDDLAYLRNALPVLLKRRMDVRDPDLVGELVLCMEYLDFEDHPVYVQGLEFLLESQNQDGSWGDYPAADRRYGDFARHHIYLHTTKLALTALVNAYRCPG
jgi:hypothetical protein